MDLARAYVQIIPTTKGMNKNLTNELNGELSTAGTQGGLSWGNALTKVVGATMGTVTALVGTATTAVSALTKQSVESYANYEQLAGGVETMFEDLSWDVEQYANRAFMTAGLSANDYMETVMGFSAALTSSLTASEGNIGRAADLADQIIVDMSDNANKMGSSMESIQNAYSGFAKQNYTMLDNLKLGYGGTKQEMERLLKDAEKLSGIKYDISSFADIAEAIHVVQEEMGIAGTTALEASTTISGSLASVGSAWQNVLLEMSKDGGEFDRAIDDLITTIVGTGNGDGALAQIIPRIETTLLGVGELVTKLAPVIAERVPPMIEKVAPSLIKAVQTLISSLAKQLPSLLQAIIKIMPDLMNLVINTLIELTPLLLDCALQLVEALTEGLEEALPILVPPTMEMLLKVTDTLINNLDLILNCAFRIIGALVDGLVKSTPMLLDQGAKLVVDIAKAIEDTLWTIVIQGTYLVDRLIKGFEDKTPELLAVAKSLPEKIKNEFFKESYKIQEQGTNFAVDILTGMSNGITKMLGDGNWVSNIINKIINALKNSFKATWESVDWFSGVQLPTVPVNLSTAVQTTAASTTNYIPNGAPSNVTVDVKVTQDPTKQYKATVSKSYTTSKASGIPSGVLSKIN